MERDSQRVRKRRIRCQEQRGSFNRRQSGVLGPASKAIGSILDRNRGNSQSVPRGLDLAPGFVQPDTKFVGHTERRETPTINLSTKGESVKKNQVSSSPSCVGSQGCRDDFLKVMATASHSIRTADSHTSGVASAVGTSHFSASEHKGMRPPREEGGAAFRGYSLGRATVFAKVHYVLLGCRSSS